MDENSICPPQNCNVMQLLPLLMDDNTQQDVICPSKLMYELQMSTEERLERLSKPTRKFRISTEINTFSRTPDIVVFQNFKEKMVYSTTLSLLNLHPVSRHLRIAKSSSPYFKITHPADNSSAKVAPGISYSIVVSFMPLANKDYVDSITFLTDGESFKVPLYGIGYRPLLNLPDHIELPPTAVRVTSGKSIILHNFGKVPASYVVSCKSPFSVSPYKDVLQSGNMMELKVFCKSSVVGMIKGHLDFCYGDIKLNVSLACEVTRANIYLEKDSLVFDNTYMHLRTQATVVVHNDSDHKIDFQWKLYKSYAIDELETAKLISNISNIQDLEKKRCNKLERMNIIDYEGHSSICNRSFEDEVKELESSNLHLYKNPIFDVLPLTGEILPNQSFTITVVFSPKKNVHYESWAYLDITGREDRLSLNLRGVGKGPYVIFNMKVLNINDVFICATHQYELVVKNEGCIPATVIFKENATDFGGIISCTPNKIHLSQQNVCEAFIISFYSKIQGKFLERIEFIIKESGDVLHLILTGNVVCPLLKLNVKEIDFGVVPFGFQRSKTCILINDSQVPIDFNLTIDVNEHIPMESGYEFNLVQFEPDRGIVEAYSEEPIEVSLATGAVQEVNDNLKVNMWGSKRYSISIPLKYNCVCPKIKCNPNKIYIKFCFLGYEYKRVITLVNDSDVPGFLSYTPPEGMENDPDLVCILDKREFMVNPFEKIQIELSIVIKVLGIHEFPLMFKLAGSKPEETCKVICNGQGPVVSYSPDDLDFGHIQLLQQVSKELTLINDSPVKANITVTMPSHSVFKVDVHHIEIDPEDTYDLIVRAYLTDTGRYKSVINVNITNGENMKISVFGDGVGYSIQCEPDLTPEYNANMLLTYQKFVLPVTFTNMGKRFYQIQWSRKSVAKTLKEAVDNTTESHFEIVPSYLELRSKESQKFDICGFSKKAYAVEEDFYCYACIDKDSKANMIMQFIMKAEFIEPSVETSKSALTFMLTDESAMLEDTISITNDTEVPLAIEFYTSSDYFLIGDDDVQQSCVYYEIEAKGKFSAKIKYVPHFEERRYFEKKGTFTIDYLNHPKSAKLGLSTEVCFPTVKLHPPEYDFSCIPLNSCSYTKIIIQNITFLPVNYTWHFLEEYFEIEELPVIQKRHSSKIPELTPASSESSLSEESKDVTSEDALKEDNKDAEVTEPPKVEMNNVEEEKPVEEIKCVWDKNQYAEEMKKILVPVLEKFTEDIDDHDMIEDIKDRNISAYKISDFLTIEPFEGFLEPYECGLATIGFFPPPNIKITAKAMCTVEDGEFEMLTISGMSSKISFVMDKESVEFGRKVFCEICEEYIVLTNNGHCAFNFFVKCDDIKGKTDVLEPGWLNVNPNNKLIPPGECVTLKVKYFPGIVGEFFTKFIIEIGYLEPMTIKIHGYATFSQLHLSLPRPLIRDQPLSTSYDTISALSMGYLRTLEEVNNVNVPPYYYVPGCPADIPKILCKLLREDGWVVISKNNIYPSEMDMDLSMERMLIRQHVLDNENVLMNHTFHHKIITIPGFVTPPYVLDFGYVIIDTRVCFTVLLLNYGPAKTLVKILEVRRNTLTVNQLKVDFKQKLLDVGEIAELFVLFNPTAKRYTDLDEHVEDNFSLIVRHGATIPVIIKATVTLPRLTFEHACVDFGAVKLGECLRRSILIHNNGHVLSKWIAELQTCGKGKKTSYFIKSSQGELLPGNKQLVDIYFVPKVKGFAQAKLILYIEGNSETPTLQMCGHGTESSLAFSLSYLDFKSVLPYSQNNELVLKIQNVSTSPIEFCFSDFDLDYEEEKIWIEAFLCHFNLKRVFIPHRAAGDKLPDTFQGNYFSLISKLRHKLIEKNKSEAGESESFEDPLVNLSQNEIVELLKDHIESTTLEKDTVHTDTMKTKDNYFLSTAVVEPENNIEIDPKDQRHGICIIFHGGPNTEYYKASNRAGITLSLPVYSIDRLIYECLVEDESKAANDINTMINEAFAAVATDEDLIPIPGDDEYDKCSKKVLAILTNPPKKPPKKGGKGAGKAGKDKASDKSSGKKGKKDVITDTLVNIPLEWFCNILEIKLKKIPNGLIIESLWSSFLRKTHIALDCLLRAIGNVKYIHLIILSYGLQDYLRDEEERIKEEERQKEALLLLEAPKEEAMEEKGGKSKSKAASKSDKSSGKSSGKSGGKSSGKSSDKSKKSKKEKPKNYAKQILKDMPKPLKLDYDTFAELLKAACQVYEFWDKRNGVLIKPQTNKSPPASKVDIKSSTKDSAKESRMSSKKKRASTELKETICNLEETGIYFWLINNAHKERPIDFSEIICDSLKENLELEKAKKELDESKKEHIEETAVRFSVIPKLKRRKKTFSDLIIISNCETLKEQNDNDVFAIVASNTSSERSRDLKRRRTSSVSSSQKRQSSVEKQSITSSEKGKEAYIFTPRCILQPEEIAQFRFAFYPTKCDTYDYSFGVEIIGVKSVHLIKCHAVCEIPKLDFTPELVFPKTLENYRDKCFYDNFVYIKDENVLDLGTLIFDAQMSYFYECNLLLRNTSDLPCEVAADLSDSSQYFLKSNVLIIEPGCEDNLTVCVRPQTTDYINSILYISTKNNPKVETVKLVAKPCKLEFTVKPKAISFEKVPLDFGTRRKLSLINSSPISLWWKFVDAEWALAIYRISELENLLSPYSVADVEFVYSPVEEEVHEKDILQIQVFDLNLSNETPIYTDFITLQAESVQYNVEYEDNINLGEIKGGIAHKFPFTMLNRTKTPICVVISQTDMAEDKDMDIRKLFQITNQTVTLQPQKLFTATVLFNPTENMNFNEVPIFLCSFVESDDHESVIRSFAVKVSAVVCMSSVEVCPASDMYFGYQKVLTSKKQIIELKNDGKFSFEYKIVSLKQEIAQKNKELKAKESKSKSKSSDKSSKKSKDKSESTKKSKATEKGSKKSKDSKKSKGSKKSKDAKKGKGRKPTKLNVECFCIISSTGEVEPDQTVEVQVECVPRLPKEYEEVIIIYVSEPQKQDLNGKHITLHASSCEPCLNFSDYTKMFKEQFVVDKMEHFICPKNMGSHCIFVSSEVTLHFKHVCINTTCVSKIHVQNNGHVLAHVTAKITDPDREIFTVFPSEFDVHPYGTEIISIVFRPDTIGEFDKKLEIAWDSSVNNKFILSLSGEGLIPRTSLVEPKIQEDKECTIDFIPTYVGLTSSKRICIKNIGILASKVIIEICKNFNEIFNLVACDDSFALLNISNLEDFRNTNYSTLVNLQPYQTASFDLVFKPKCGESVDIEIKIHTVNNPFELIKINVTAQSYYHDIYLEGLFPRTEHDLSDVEPCVGYDLDFGFSVLNAFPKKYFAIKNNSEKNIYKFEFGSFDNLKFIPRVGHLKPFANKEIIVTYSTRKSLYLDKVMIECKLNKIEYVHRELEKLSWDERQQFVIWDSPCIQPSKETSSVINKTSLEEETAEVFEREMFSESKIFETNIRKVDDRPEPEIIITPETSETIPIFFTIIADYSSYTTEVEDVNLPDTFLKEQSEMNLDIENTGLIPLQIEWEFYNCEVFPIATPPVDNANNSDALAAIDHDLPERKSSHSTSLFSSEASYEEETSPFTIIPTSISICPNKCQTFSLQFSPTKLAQYSAKLKSNIACLHPQLKNLDIKVTGTGLMPTYYFDIEESDYLNRRAEGVQTCLGHHYSDPKIIEFESVGIGVLSTRKFNLINPTNEIISYKFETLEDNPQFSYFHCKTPSGFVLDNKKSEIVFTFEPQEFGNFEGYYMFQSLREDLKIPFLLAGKCRQPMVYFTKSHIIIKPTVLRVEATATAVLRNEEDIELCFKFDEDSLLNEVHDQQLGIAPMYGKIFPKSDLNICLTFLAEKIGEVDFYLKCAVEKARNPLNLNVTAKCLEVLSSVSHTDKEGRTLIAHKNKENVINFGNVIPNRKENIQVTISNTGQTGFFYNWNFNKKPIEHLFDFFIDSKKEFVGSNNESKVVMSVEALRRCTLRDFIVKLNISYGPTYVFNIHATAEKPLCSFSFKMHNFGYCIVQKRKTDYYNVGLEFKNFGIRLLTLENCFVNNEDLTVDFKSAQVPSCFSQHIPIYFHPSKVGQYKISIPFIVDSIKYIVKIRGEAVKVDLQLVSANDKYVDLGGVMVGSPKQYTVQVINKTPTEVNVFFDLWEKLPFHSRPKEKIESGIKVPEIPPPVKKEKKEKKGKGKKSDKSSKSTDKSKKGSKKGDKKKGKDKKSSEKSTKKSSKGTDKTKGKGKGKKKGEPEIEVIEPVFEPPKKTILDFLNISPKDCVKLEPNKKCEFVIEFHPTERIENFSKQIFYETQDYVEPLCMVKGSCIAPDFSLDKNFLTFSNVVVGCRHSLNIILRNTGDIKGRFKWLLESDREAFKIYPNDGFVSPTSEVKVWISFEPMVIECLFKTKALCIIENVEKPLELLLMGNSVKIPNPTSIISLTCPVRESVEQTILISNTTKSVWIISPIISSDQFSASKEMRIEPGTSYPLVINYHPKQMTVLNPHHAILFLPLPEGQAIVYQLTGNTLPPLPIGTIEIEMACKKSHTELLHIENWLPVRQCFKVTTELTSTITTKCLYKASGNEFVELFPNESKDYRWNIYVINEIPLTFKVIFTDTETNEYMFYEVSVNVLPSGSLETIDVVTCVREFVKTTIKLQNPIDVPVNFLMECDAPNLLFDKTVSLEPYSTYDLEIQYQPLKSEAMTVNFVAKCDELGVFNYCLNLTANPPVTETMVKFRAELGDTTSKSVYFNNTFNAPVEFTAMFDYPVFSMEKSGPIPVGGTGNITFNFVPSELGTLKSKVVITSPVTGDYVYPLIGECVLPSPKGPFFIQAGGSTSIDFVNPFEEEKEFCYNIDSNAFFLKTLTEIIKPKKSTKIIINMQSTKNLDMNLQNCPVTAKLIVNCEDSELEDIKWVYYIQGQP